MKKRIICVVSFLLAFVLIVGVCREFFSFKYLDSIYKMEAFYELEDNTVDVLVLGTSHAYQGVNTAVLWQEYGYTAYDLCGSAQPLWNTYFYLEEALKTQTPKLILLDAFAVHYTFDYSEPSKAIKNTYGLKFSATKLNAIRESFDFCEHGLQYYFEFLQSHSRYSDTSESDLYPYLANEELYKNSKGFYCYYTSKAVEDVDVSNVQYLNYMTDKNYEYYTKIIELAQSKNIPIAITVIPFVTNQYYQGHFNEAEKIAEEYGVPFYNFFTDYKTAINLDYSTDFADSQHLNHLGNTKLTRFLGEMIKEEYNVTDKRGDEKYESWQIDADNYNHTLKNSKITSITNADEYFEQINDKNYTLICSLSFKDADNLNSNSNDLINVFFDEMNVSYKQTNGFWVFGDGKTVYSNTKTENGFSKNFDLGKVDGVLLETVKSGKDSDAAQNVNNIHFNKTKMTKSNEALTILVYDEITQELIDCVYVDFSDGSFKREQI